MRRSWIPIALVCLVAAGCSLQTTGATKGNLQLLARFADVGNLVSGEAVDIGAVQVGSVVNIELVHYKAVVTMAVDSNEKVPIGTVAVLSQTTLLGEPYIGLQLPTNVNLARSRAVQSGSYLPTSTTESIELFTGEASGVVGALAGGNLGGAIQALSQGLGGKGPELHQAIGDLTKVAAAIASQQDNLAAIIDNSGKLGASLAGGSPQIGTLVDDLASATTTLAANRGKLLAALTQFSRLASDLNYEVILPHLTQIEQLIGDLSPILSQTAQSKDVVEGLVTGLKSFVLAFPNAVSGGQVLLNVWLAGIINDGGATSSFNSANAPSLTSLLEPTQ